jgi:hypothetical protein
MMPLIMFGLIVIAVVAVAVSKIVRGRKINSSTLKKHMISGILIPCSRRKSHERKFLCKDRE